ncbi:MAG: TlyA family RNA methyltransferase [Clostridia bacterium]|nr:TlyA family RNA methyltransferase [Clostridia bacterium]
MKQRLDVLLVSLGLCQSRERAKTLIENGQVLLNGNSAKKSGQSVDETVKIEIVGTQNPYVSRGGLKLEKAIDAFKLTLKDKVAMDIGASTGGFTHCMLKNGAKKVYAVDVGKDQLHESLRADERVLNMEKTNIRNLEADKIEPLDFISVDVSFISLKLVLPKVYEFLKPKGLAVLLIKPQFEAGKQHLNKKGVVKDKKVHLTVVREVTAFASQLGLGVLNLSFSPIRGPEGNIEYLLLVQKDAESVGLDLEKVVLNSHEAL